MFENNTFISQVIIKQCLGVNSENDAWDKRLYDKLSPQKLLQTSLFDIT